MKYRVASDKKKPSDMPLYRMIGMNNPNRGFLNPNSRVSLRPSDVLSASSRLSSAMLDAASEMLLIDLDRGVCLERSAPQSSSSGSTFLTFGKPNVTISTPTPQITCS